MHAAATANEAECRQVDVELAELANRLATMGRLSAAIAHEVNQPITAAVTQAQAALRWLCAPQPDLEEVRHALRQIVKDGNRAGEIIGRVRDVIMKAPPRQDGLRINEPIVEAINLTREEARRNGISLSTQLAEGLPLVHGDRVLLEQVMLNLIVNAIEAMSETAGEARDLQIITRKATSNTVLVAVRDSGPGIAPANLKRIFDAFYTTKRGGLGMGLSICRSIIEAHGGCLWATAKFPRGTAMQFTLPVYSARAGFAKCA